MAKARGANLVTGFPAFSARRLVELLLERGEKVFLLCQAKFEKAAGELAADAEQKGLAGRLVILVGDVLNIDMGLSGRELKQVAREVTRVHHIAAIYYLGVASGLTERVNVDGTRNVLDVASDLDRLERFVFHSTAFVAGDRTGVILEEELEAGQGFRNAYERTKFDAERLVRGHMKDLPISVVRPSIIVGDSKTGRIDRMDGPYFLIRTIVNFPVDVALPLPEGGAYPLNMVPVDYVVQAADLISRDPGAAGKTFHLTDPNPLPAHKVFDMVADNAGRKRPKGSIPSLASKYLLRLPGVEMMLRPQRHFFEYFNRLTIYNCMNTLTSLAGTGVTCPTFPSYAATLVDFVKNQARQKAHSMAKAETEIEDAFY
ncbi:MAG: SDR family oxidoreductase [Deltaproteobacteria bacterium]|nr:SDR family oxidoreductase [Deltaproteobacteria bacterium]